MGDSTDIKWPENLILICLKGIVLRYELKMITLVKRNHIYCDDKLSVTFFFFMMPLVSSSVTMTSSKSQFTIRVRHDLWTMMANKEDTWCLITILPFFNSDCGLWSCNKLSLLYKIALVLCGGRCIGLSLDTKVWSISKLWFSTKTTCIELQSNCDHSC